jgi:hypothetical protein
MCFNEHGPDGSRLAVAREDLRRIGRGATPHCCYEAQIPQRLLGRGRADRARFSCADELLNSRGDMRLICTRTQPTIGLSIRLR